MDVLTAERVLLLLRAAVLGAGAQLAEVALLLRNHACFGVIGYSYS